MTALRISKRGPTFRFTSAAGVETRAASGARAAVRLAKLGPRGATGPTGAQGPQGDPAMIDPGDLTLIFDNHLL